MGECEDYVVRETIKEIRAKLWIPAEGIEEMKIPLTDYILKAIKAPVGQTGMPSSLQVLRRLLCLEPHPTSSPYNGTC